MSDIEPITHHITTHHGNNEVQSWTSIFKSLDRSTKRLCIQSTKSHVKNGHPVAAILTGKLIGKTHLWTTKYLVWHRMKCVYPTTHFWNLKNASFCTVSKWFIPGISMPYMDFFWGGALIIWSYRYTAPLVSRTLSPVNEGIGLIKCMFHVSI